MAVASTRIPVPTGRKAQELLMGLVRADREEEVEELLRSSGLWDRPEAWRLLGDEQDNYRIVGAQASVAEAALAEKLTNAIDANLMRRCLEDGVDPRGPDAPQSVREAVARFYDVNPRGSYSGSLAEWDNPKILRVARSTTRVSLTGNRRRQINRMQNHPSVTILDFGEGQAPENHPDTLLSIGQSLKLGIPFQHGKFNMGGTAALRFCGQKHLQLVLSRRAPRIAAQEGVSTDWGFTIVRKDYTRGERMSVYRYLAPIDGPEGEVLRFAADSLPIGPDANNPYVEKVESGTLIKLYQYQTQFRTQFGVAGGLRQELDVWLPLIPLPVRLHECRWKGAPRSSEWNLTGLSRRLANAQKRELHDTGQMTVDGQRLSYELFCMEKGASEGYRGGHSIIFPANGQAHGTLDRRIFSRQAVSLGNLRKDITVIVDCTDLDVPHLEDLTVNSRDRLADTEFRRSIERKIEETLRDHPELRRISRQRADELLQEKLTDQKPLEDVLRRIMQGSDVLNRLFLQGDRLTGDEVVMKGRKEEFTGQKHPSYFRFKGLKDGQTLKRSAHLGQRVRLDFETDVENEYFKRASLPGKHDLRLILNGQPVEAAELTYSLNLHDGLAHLNLNLPPSAIRDDSLVVELSIVDETRINRFVNRAELVIRPEQRTQPGSGGRDKNTSHDGDAQRPRPAGIAFPDILLVRRPQWDEYEMSQYSALRAVSLGGGGDDHKPAYQFQINVDNMFLQREQRRAQNRRSVIEAQWINGLTILALGLLRGYSAGADGNSRGGSALGPSAPSELDFEDLAAYFSDAVGPVLIPVVNELGSISADELLDD